MGVSDLETTKIRHADQDLNAFLFCCRARQRRVPCILSLLPTRTQPSHRFLPYVAYTHPIHTQSSDRPG